MHVCVSPDCSEALVGSVFRGSGHATRQSLEIYLRLALAGTQQRHDDVIGGFAV